MKLSYRGVQYDYIPNELELGDSYAEGMYRGLTVQFRRTVGSVPQPVYNLKYRGVAYTTGAANMPEAGIESTLPPVTAASETPAFATTKAVTHAEPVETISTISAPAGQFSLPEPLSASSPIDEEMRLLAIKHHQNVRRREQSILARFETQVGLTVQDAIHFWNHIQGKPHSDAWTVYDRSQAAMS